MHQSQNRQSAHRIPVRVLDSYADPRNVKDSTTESQSTATPAEKNQAAGPDSPQNAPTGTDWEALAKRQQAEMENFRKRQAHRAEEAAAAERERLLKLILPVADNLARALNHNGEQADLLRQGIELTQRELDRILAAEGVTRIETVGQEFDPKWHEAVTTVSAGARPDTIVTEVEAGYKLGDKLLRPAKVIVAA